MKTNAILANSILVVLGIVLNLTAGESPRRAADASRSPNIILILADDLG